MPISDTPVELESWAVSVVALHFSLLASNLPSSCVICPFSFQFGIPCSIVSNVHAALSVGLAIYTLFFEGEIYESPLPRPEVVTWGISATVGCTLSYWLYDLILLIK